MYHMIPSSMIKCHTQFNLKGRMIKIKPNTKISSILLLKSNFLKFLLRVQCCVVLYLKQEDKLSCHFPQTF
uniref:Uncharacterized protein n=1 Tax=Rhizophora mucronata TaxID=61149 RepID=A0A2P2NMQ4_RHIMU